MAKSGSRRKRKKPQSSRRRQRAKEAPPAPVEADDYSWDMESRPRRVFVCIGPSCADQKSRGILTEVKKQVDRLGLRESVHVYAATCLSHCKRAPVMRVYPEGTIYCQVQPRDVRTLVNEHLYKGEVVTLFSHDPFTTVQWNDEIDS